MVKEKSFIQNLSVSYECALAIGNSLNLSEMLHEVIRTIVHKTNAHRGSIWLCTEGEYGIKIGARTGSKLTEAGIRKRKKHFRDVFEKICVTKQFVIRYREEKDFFQYCFNVTGKEQSVLLIPIEKVAMLHLVYASREKVDNTLGNILTGLSGKLSVAIKACMVYENIIKEIQVRKKTEKELKRKTNQLISSQKELKNLYSESELSRKSLLSILEDVVEKERALRESEQKFRILVQHSPLGIFRADAKGNIQVVNTALLKILGSPSEEKTKEINLLTFPLLINSGISKFIKECLEKRKSKNQEFIYKSKWGIESHINFYITPLYDEKEHLIGVQGIVEDISERKRTEEKYISQLKNLINLGMNMRMELKLENLLQNICDLIVKSLGWQQVTLSLRDYVAGTSKPVAMSGYDKKIVENAFSKPPVSFDILNKFLKDKYKISRSYYIDHTNWKMVKEYPAFIITPSRDPKPEGWDERDFLLIPITGKKNILGFISPDNPVSGERPTKETIQALEIFADQAAVAIENAKLYEELQNSENRFQDIAVNTGDWIWETDKNGRYTYSSPIVKQVLGYEYKEMLGKYFYDFFAPEERDKIKKAALNTFAQKKSFHNFINRNIHKEGREVILETSGIPVIDANGELIGYRGVDRDITERKKAEELQATIYNISNAVNTAKDLNEFFETLHTQLSIIINTTNFYLALYNKENDTISLPYHIDKKDRFTSFPAGRTLTSYVIRKGKSLLATEKDCDDLVKAGEIDLVGTPSKIWLGVPLKIENEVIGLVGVQSYTEETLYDEEDMKILEFVSDQTALAIDRMKKAEQINKDLEEKKVMLMEIHHRVKNNMQVISSMLKLQSRYIRDDHDLKLFNDSCHRVKSMSLIHEKLYQSKDLTSIDFADYVKSLTIHLFSSFGIDVSIIKFIINIKSVLLNINMAIPCGLIVNELITNSLKYAFPDNRKGEISINLKSEPCIETPERKIYSLIVSDNGIGLPANFDFENTASFGLQLVNTLLQQLHANIEIDRKSGTSFKIVFKELQL